MAEADDKGIPLEDYIKVKPEPLVRTKLDRGELRYTWVDADGNARASDDGGPQPPKGWWGMVNDQVRSRAAFGEGFGLRRTLPRDVFRQGVSGSSG